MSSRKKIVERYFEGFRLGDHELVLGCLTDDVVWDLRGFKYLEGKAAFDGEIENDAFEGRPALTLDRLVEEGDTVVALGAGRARTTDGMDFRSCYADVFTFNDEAVCRVESYVIPLSAPPPSA